MFGDEVLTKPSIEIPTEIIRQQEVQDLIANMKAILFAADALGLAAPQVGAGIRIALIRAKASEVDCDDVVAPEDKLSATDFLLTMINPKIIVNKDIALKSDIEGCLSIPGIFLRVDRAVECMLIFTTIHGTPGSLQTRGDTARRIQHEIDHLDGLMIVDRCGRVKRSMILKKIANMKREGTWAKGAR